MVSSTSKGSDGPVSDAQTQPLVDRIRIGLWILLASNLVFAIGDLALERSLLVPLWLLKLCQVITVISAFVALRMRTGRTWTISVGLVTVAVAAAMTAASGVVTRETIPTTILGVTGVMLTGALLPWGLWPQLTTAAMTGAAIAANAYLVTGSALGPLHYVTFAVVVALAESAFIAYEFERRRAALERENRQRQQTLRTLRQSEQNFRGIFEHLEDIFYRTDLQGTLQMISPSVERYGYRVGDLIGRNVAALYPDPAVRERNIALLLERGSLRDFELTLRAGDGTLIPVSTNVRVLFNEAGTPIGVEGMLRDITERKRTEQNVRASEQDLRDIFEHLQDVFYRTDLQGRIQRISPSVQRYGYHVDELIGADVARLYKNPAERRRYIAALTEDTYVRDFEITLQDAHGHPIPVSATARLLRDPEGGAVGVEGVLRDITRRKRAEEELAAAKDLAEAADRTKSEFLATVSHEIRTPMNGIIGMTGLLLDTPLTPQQRDYAETIRSSGETLLGIINDILDFSKIEAGKLELDVVDFDLRQIVREVIDLFAEAARRKHLELAVLIYHDVLPALRGDPGRLRQILTNLLSNAIKFTETGEVVLRVKQVAETRSAVSLRTEVSDTGIGISPQVRERLFQPFSQADASTTRKYGGTGLGLAICQQLTHMMAGELGVDSEPGKGSTFWFTVWLEKQGGGLAAAPSRAKSLSTTAPAAAAAPPGRGATVAAATLDATPRVPVLVAEDNAVNQKVIVHLLEKLGYRADVVANGVEAIEALSRIPYSAILMDCRMPEMDGFAATEHIRQDERRHRGHTPIIALTANAMDGDRERCLAAGMDDYLRKPVTLDALAAALTRCQAGKARRVEAPPPSTLAAREILDRALCMQRLGGNPQLIRHLVELFRADCPRLLAAIQAAVADRNAAALERAAHTLKGAASNFAAGRVVEAAQRLEMLGRSEDLADAAAASAALEEEMTRLLAMLAELEELAVA